jgi:hypothetical protein
MGPLATLLLVFGVVAALIAVGWGFHRLCIYLEDRGYLYYRKRPTGGGGIGNVLQDIDRLARPSIEYVIRVQEEAQEDDRADVGGR